MFVITAIVGNSFRNDRSLSSASATISSPLPEPRVAAERAQPAADDRRRIEPRALEHERDHRRRRRLAVRARDRDAVAEPHQLREHLGPRNHRDRAAAPPRRTSGFVGRTADDTTTTSASPTCAASCPSSTRTPSVASRSVTARSLLVRAADRVPEIGEQLGDAAHADAADPDEVHAPRLAEHRPSRRTPPDVRRHACRPASVPPAIASARSTITPRRVRPRQRARRRAPSARRRAAVAGQRQDRARPARSPGQLALRQHLGGARRGQRLGVLPLVVVGRRRQRNQDRRACPPP